MNVPPPMKDYYAILEVPQNASADSIKKAYRRLALILHPDHNSNSIEATEAFKELGQANDVLSNPRARAKYDADLKKYSQQSHPSGSTAPRTAAPDDASRQKHKKDGRRPTNPAASEKVIPNNASRQRRRKHRERLALWNKLHDALEAEIHQGQETLNRLRARIAKLDEEVFTLSLLLLVPYVTVMLQLEVEDKVAEVKASRSWTRLQLEREDEELRRIKCLLSHANAAFYASNDDELDSIEREVFNWRTSSADREHRGAAEAEARRQAEDDENRRNAEKEHQREYQARVTRNAHAPRDSSCSETLRVLSVVLVILVLLAAGLTEVVSASI